MNWMEVLRQYRDAPATPPPQTMDDFDSVAHEVPREDLAAGIEEAFRSEQTPPMEQLMRRLFEHSDPEQRAGFLNAVGSRPGITANDARDVPPQDVEEIARAARDNPSILQRASSFYAQHPQLVRVLGQAVLGVAMNAMAQRRRV